MSHLSLQRLKQNLIFLKKYKVKNICLDTEGAQIRTGKVLVQKFMINQKIIIGFDKKKIKNYISVYPKFNIQNLKKNTEIYIGFEGLKCKIIKHLKGEKIECTVIESGLVEDNKGVHINQNINLIPLTEKDHDAIKLAIKYNVKKFALSFANDTKGIDLIKKLTGKNSFIISKIETKKGFMNRKNIIKKSNAVLIDRGDLSRYVPISKIPFAQKMILSSGKKEKTPIYVATNLLESMVNSKFPTRAESNDINTTLECGANGLVLAAESAIGKYPYEAVIFLKQCIKNYTIMRKNKFQEHFLFKRDK
jgi:pyruvate kinase